MAVAAPPLARSRSSAGVHFRLLLWARWQSYRNLLRRSGIKRAKFLTSLLTWLLAIIGGGGTALAFFGFGYQSGHREKLELIGVGLTLAFLLWQLTPIIFEITSPTLNFRDIARYPITLRTYYLLHLAFGLLDISVLLSLTWVFSLWLGLLFGRPLWAAKAVLPFLAFVTFNLVSNRAILSIVEHIVATRRGRERMLATLALLAIAAQVGIYGAIPRLGEARIKALLTAIFPILKWTPPGAATFAVIATPPSFVLAISALAAYSLIAAWILRWRLYANFTGEDYSESARPSGAVQMRPGWSLPFVNRRISAIIEKEVRYALRDSRTLINLAFPTGFALILVLSRGFFARMMQTGLHVSRGSWQIYPSVTAVLFISHLAYNSFGTDASGFARWALSPASTREVLLGKNLAVILLWTASLLCANLVMIVGLEISYWLLLVTLLAVFFGAVTILAAGNQLSVRLPARYELGTSSRNVPEGVMLASMLLTAGVTASVLLVHRYTRSLSAHWIEPLSLVLLSLIAIGLYLVSLRNAAHYLERNTEKIGAELEK